MAPSSLDPFRFALSEPYWDDLRIFLAVVAHGSMNSAAKALGQSQPTIARRIKVLEETFGLTLFQRGPNSLELTQRYRPNCDFDRVRRAWSGAPVLLMKLFSVDRVYSAIFIGVLLFAAIKTMNAAAKTEFLYFNF